MITFTNDKNQKCRLSAIENINGIYKATIYIYDTNEFVRRNYNLIEKYL